MHQRKDSDESPERPDKQEPHKDPGREDPGYSLAPEEAPVEKKPEAYEKPKRKSARRRRGEDEGEAAGPQGPDGELPSDPPSGSLSLETLHSRSQEGLDFKPSPPLSKVSVIPHDLFYYPHYEVPLAAVLEAYAEGSEDLKHRDLDLEEPEDYLHDLGAGAEAEEAEEAEGSWNSCSFSGPDEEGPEPSIPAPSTDRGAEGTRSASEPAPPAPPEGHQPAEAEESGPVDSHQVGGRRCGDPGPRTGILLLSQLQPPQNGEADASITGGSASLRRRSLRLGHGQGWPPRGALLRF